MKNSFLLLVFILTISFASAQRSTLNDGDWAKNNVVMKATPEADVMIRLGDIDNLGFAFDESFDPFCGRTYDAHSFPWDANPNDIEGLDRILLGSKLKPNEGICGGDGYSSSYDESKTKPVPYIIRTNDVEVAMIQNACLQMFVDDFQAPQFCSKFVMTINGTRFVEGERVLNILDQTGPVGKLITLTIPEEFYPAIESGSLSILIDETAGSADGFAIDFLKLIINRKTTQICRGDIAGKVFDEATGDPISGAIVTGPEGKSAKTNAEGYFSFKDVPAGIAVLSANYPGYNEGYVGADIAKDTENPDVQIQLRKGEITVEYDGKEIKAGQTVVMNNILFDQGSSVLRPESKTELDKIVSFLQTNSTVEIEISGHTSSEGDPMLNRSLSYKRVKACKDYIVSKGIDTGRLVAVGFGADKPVASNDTEDGRKLNRRVEMRVVKL